MHRSFYLVARNCESIRRHSARPGFSLVEILAVVTILGILALVIVPRFADKSKDSACRVNIGNIEVQAQLWYRNKGQWPAGDLSDIGNDPRYFPDGLPKCPVDGASYDFDASRSQVRHEH
jgi:general secretion pathway protein G